MSLSPAVAVHDVPLVDAVQLYPRKVSFGEPGGGMSRAEQGHHLVAEAALDVLRAHGAVPVREALQAHFVEQTEIPPRRGRKPLTLSATRRFLLMLVPTPGRRRVHAVERLNDGGLQLPLHSGEVSPASELALRADLLCGHRGGVRVAQRLLDERVQLFVEHAADSKLGEGAGLKKKCFPGLQRRAPDAPTQHSHRAMTVFSDIDLSRVEYKSLSTNARGGKVVYTMAQTKDGEPTRLRFQLSATADQTMLVPWGVSTPLDSGGAGGKVGKLGLDIAVDGEVKQFLQKLDASNVDAAERSSMEWFKKPIDRSALNDMYCTIVRHPKTEGMPVTVKTKLRVDENPTEVWVCSGQNGVVGAKRGTHLDVVKGSKVVAVVETTGLWFMNRQFGMSLTITEMLVWPPKQERGIKAFTLGPGVTLNVDEPTDEPMEDASFA